MCKKIVIGLTGPIGAGKTLVAKILLEFECAVIDADALVHEILQEKTAKDFLRDNFGDKVFDASGRLDRKKMADIVFADPDKIRKLEAFIHPLVIQRQQLLIDKYRQEPAVRAIVLDIPLLIESGLKHLCDIVILVDAELQIRQNRVSIKRNWSPLELARREKFFFSIYLKRSIADAIVNNNSTIEACQKQVERIFSRIISSVPCKT